MERLFDLDEPSFVTCIWMFDIDYPFRQRMFEDRPPRPEVDPQNYATLCESRPFAGHFTTNHLGDIDVRDTLKWATRRAHLRQIRRVKPQHSR